MRADHTLGLRNGAAAHAELAKTHADQRRNRGAVAAHFAADAERFSSRVKNCADMLDQAEHSGRIHLVVVRNLRISTVHGERILAQIVCADTGKVRLLRNLVSHQCDRRNFNHDAEPDVACAAFVLQTGQSRLQCYLKYDTLRIQNNPPPGRCGVME